MPTKEEIVEHFKRKGGKEADLDHDHMDKIIGFMGEWRDVAERLPGVESNDIPDRERDGHNEREKRTLFMKGWKQKNSFLATYDALVTAMAKAKRASDATKVCDLLLPGTS